MALKDMNPTDISTHKQANWKGLIMDCITEGLIGKLINQLYSYKNIISSAEIARFPSTRILLSDYESDVKRHVAGIGRLHLHYFYA